MNLDICMSELTENQKTLILTNIDEIEKRLYQKYRDKLLTKATLNHLPEIAISFDSTRKTPFIKYAMIYLPKRYIDYLRKNKKIQESNYSEHDYTVYMEHKPFKELEWEDLKSSIIAQSDQYFTGKCSTDNACKILIKNYLIPKAEGNIDHPCLKEISEQTGVPIIKLSQLIHSDDIKTFINKFYNTQNMEL